MFDRNDNALMIIFQENPKIPWKSKFCEIIKHHDTFTKLIQQNVTINNQWYKHNMKKKYECKSYDRTEFYSTENIKSHKDNN